MRGRYGALADQEALASGLPNSLRILSVNLVVWSVSWIPVLPASPNGQHVGGDALTDDPKRIKPPSNHASASHQRSTQRKPSKSQLDAILL